MSSIVIGKQGTQPFQINDQDVSRQHATLYIDDTTRQMAIMDNNSTNGTFVHNGQTFVRLQPGVSYTVTPDTMVQLGPNTRFHLRRVLEQPKPAQPRPAAQQKPAAPKKPEKKRVDIRPLRLASDKYNDAKIKVEKGNDRVQSMQSLTLIGSMVSGGAVQAIDFDQFTQPVLLRVVATVVVFAFVFAIIQIVKSSMKNKVIKLRNASEKEYKIRYCCPECHTAFAGRLYENILAEGSCPKCKAEFYDSEYEKK